jgi:antitoxin (DNA-binding transcriptional repressor) of toxin-antitoxin stability system
MKEATAGIRELKSRLSHYLRLVKAGRIVEVTERGRTVARIEAAVRSGLVSWNGRRLRPRAPAARVRPGKTVAELVVEGRR